MRRRRQSRLIPSGNLDGLFEVQLDEPTNILTVAKSVAVQVTAPNRPRHHVCTGENTQLLNVPGFPCLPCRVRGELYGDSSEAVRHCLVSGH